MKESTLQQVRNDYNLIKKEKEEMLGNKNELKSLLESQKVKRFLELVEKLSLVYDEPFEDFMSKMLAYKGPSEETMVRMAYECNPEAIGIENINSNNIMVFMGSYIKSDTNEDNDYITYKRNPNTSYRLYMDLETGIPESVPKEECYEYEKNNITLYLPISEYSEKEYSQKYAQLQKWFKAQLIHRSQEEVIKEMQEKYDKKYKGLSLPWKIIDAIHGLPIDDFVNQNAANGFVEKFSLTEEERLLLKLYRQQDNK